MPKIEIRKESTAFGTFVVVRCKGCGYEWAFDRMTLVTDVIEVLKRHRCREN